MYLIFNICRYFFIKQYYTTKKTICPRFYDNNSNLFRNYCREIREFTNTAAIYSSFCSSSSVLSSATGAFFAEKVISLAGTSTNSTPPSFFSFLTVTVSLI